MCERIRVHMTYSLCKGLNAHRKEPGSSVTVTAADPVLPPYTASGSIRRYISDFWRLSDKLDLEATWQFPRFQEPSSIF